MPVSAHTYTNTRTHTRTRTRTHTHTHTHAHTHAHACTHMHKCTLSFAFPSCSHGFGLRLTIARTQRRSCKTSLQARLLFAPHQTEGNMPFPSSASPVKWTTCSSCLLGYDDAGIPPCCPCLQHGFAIHLLACEAAQTFESAC